MVESNDHVVFFLPHKRLVREVEKLFRERGFLMHPPSRFAPSPLSHGCAMRAERRQRGAAMGRARIRHCAAC